jgi:cardiolipin synthase
VISPAPARQPLIHEPTPKSRSKRGWLVNQGLSRGRVRRRLGVAGGVVAAILAVAGCSTPATSAGAPSAAASASASAAAAAAAATGTVAADGPADPAGADQLIQEPAAGYGPIDDLIGSAHASVTMTMYELSDPTATADLIAAHRRGVDVRVLLDSAYAGHRVNQTDYDELAAAGVTVRWAPADTIYHEKALTVDGTEAAVMTGNLTARYYTGTRDAIVITHDPAQVKAIGATFAADLAATAGTGATDQAAGLVWSPGAENAVLTLVRSARSSIDLSSEEMTDRSVVDALEAAARRGIDVRIVMTQDPSNTRDLDELAAAGAHVHVFPDVAGTLYMHEKQLLIDDDTLLIGSQNLGVASLVYNRELSVQLTRGRRHVRCRLSRGARAALTIPCVNDLSLVDRISRSCAPPDPTAGSRDPGGAGHRRLCDAPCPTGADRKRPQRDARGHGRRRHPPVHRSRSVMPRPPPWRTALRPGRERCTTGRRSVADRT